MVIYQIENKINNKKYIGQSTDYMRRYKKHIYNAENWVQKRLYDSIRKYGSENFEISIICECKDKNDMNLKEVYYIKEYDTLHPNGYNMSDGGEGGYTLSKWSDEDKKELYKRQSESRKGQKRTKEQKENMSKSAKLRVEQMTQEEKDIFSKKVSNTCKEKGIKPPEHTMFKKGEGGFYGKKHSDNSKKKISEFRSGKSYEEIYRSEKAKDIKEQKSKSMIGSNNINFVEFTLSERLRVLEAMYEDLSVTMTQLEQLVNKSPYKIRNFLKEIGIGNFQEFKRMKDTNNKEKIIQKGIIYVKRNY